uniref:Serpentine receptor class gamma n=1 Tax=Parastrongyloides trichosuri TaxID=131310 RepID=A0A0N4ZVJ8_PARTI
MIYQNIIFIFITIFEIPSLIFLIFVHIILILPSHKEKFSSTFYSLLFWNGIIDIVSYLSFTLHHRFPNYGIFTNAYYNFYLNQTDVRVLEFLRNYTNISQLIGTFFISFNRFTSLMFPVKHRFLWKKLLPLALIVIFLLPVILTWPILCDKMGYVPQNTSDINVGFRAKWLTNNAEWYNSFIVMTVLSFIFLLACLIINLSTLIILIKMSLNNNINKEGGKQKFNFTRERNFFLSALISFMGQLLLGIDNYVSGQFSQTKQYDNFYLMVMIFPIVNDLTIFPNVWLMLYISTPLRTIVFGFFKKQKSVIIIGQANTTLQIRSFVK